MLQNDYLIEIGVEEIPHGYLKDLLSQVNEKSIEVFNSYNFKYNSITVSGTPRRIYVLIKDLSERAEDKVVEKKGPSVSSAYNSDGTASKALQGFLKSNNITEKDITRKQISGVEYIYYISKQEGKSIKELASEIFKKIFFSLNLPKSMKWGNYNLSFVRPIKWILSLYGSEHIPIEIESMKSDVYSYSHRFLGSGKLKIDNSKDYIEIIKKNYVIPDFEERKNRILSEATTEAKKINAKLYYNDELLDILSSLVEYPFICIGEFESSYLNIPKEVLISEMIEHQKYIPLLDNNDNLINKFIIVANNTPNENIKKGNARVIRARFNDGKFFFEEDQKIKLSNRLEELKNIIYAKELGSLYDKTMRLMKLSEIITNLLNKNESLEDVKKASGLSKCDLTTGMVYEFPELQGIMGYYYALSEGYNTKVALAIREQYKPSFSGDTLPSTIEGVILSLADKFDNLFAMYSRGNFVSGSKDPYALRRQTLGIIKIIIDNKLSIDLEYFYNKILELYKNYLSIDEKEYKEKIFDFITTRVKTVLKEYNFSFDEIEAGIPSYVKDIYDTYLRINEIHNIRNNEIFKKLVIAFKRVKNILKTADNFKPTDINENLFTNEAEKELYSIYKKNKSLFMQSLENKNYKECINILKEFCLPVDNFFDKVMVMDNDIKVRNNRLNLLYLLDNLFYNFIDFEKFVIE